MKKLFTLFTMMLAFTISTWAEDITIDFSTKGYENAQEIASVEQGGITLTLDKGTNKNAPKYYNTGSAIRCYGGNTITASVSGKNITQIVFTFDSGEGPNAITAEPGSFETNTWTGNASSVTFTIGGTTGHRRIQKMVFTVAASGDTRQATTIELGGGYMTKFTYGPDGDGVNLPTATVKAGETEVTGATVTWAVEKVSGNDALVPTISGNKINIPNHSYGKLNVTASYAGDATTYQPSTKSYTIDVYKGRMNIAEILEDFGNKGEEDWSAGIPTSLWMVEDYGGGMLFVSNPTVTYVNGSYTYIKDDYNNNLLLFGSGLGFQKGDVITSDQGGGEYVPIYGDLKTYNGLLELAVTQNNFQVYSSGATVTPETITPMFLSTSMNAYLKIEDAVYKSADGRNLTFTADETDFIVRQNWTNVAIDGLEVGATYTLEGMGAVYNTTPQLYLISFEKTADATAIKNIDADAANANAPIYNLAGQQVTDSYKGVVIQNGKKRLNK
ncbi:MAG: hypothetical protein IKG83_01505 [Prevotella sp.]|nr:hypothetical protein [Prevotella sp.]